MKGFSSLHNVDYNMMKGPSVNSESFSHTGGIDGLHTEHLVTSSAPFSTQLDAISGPSHRGSQSNFNPEFENPHSTRRLDLSAITNALPDGGIPPQHHNHQQSASFGGRNQSNQPHSIITYPHAQMPPMAIQQHMSHFSRQNMFPSGTPNSGGRVGYSPQASTYPMYGSYQQFVPQQHMPPQAQDMAAGMLPHYANPYTHVSLQQYPVLDQRSFLPIQSMNREFMAGTNDAGKRVTMVVCTRVRLTVYRTCITFFDC